MIISRKLILAGLAVSLLSVPACKPRGGGGPGGGPGFGPGGAGQKCGPGPAGPGPGHHYGQQDREFDVYIYSYTDASGSTKCTADVDVATLWKVKGGQALKQSVCWISDDGNDYTVNFKAQGTHGSPFQDPLGSFYVPQNGSVSSGPLLAAASGYYEFVIVPNNNPNGTPCKGPGDPGLIVKP